MASKTPDVTAKISKKALRKELSGKLSKVLSEYKVNTEDKKFHKKIVKAAKLFVIDVKKAGKLRSPKTA